MNEKDKEIEMQRILSLSARDLQQEQIRESLRFSARWGGGALSAIALAEWARVIFLLPTPGMSVGEGIFMAVVFTVMAVVAIIAPFAYRPMSS